MLKYKKSRFCTSHSHSEVSQCARVVEPAQDGGRAPEARAISGQDPGSRPMRGRIEIAQESENRQKSFKIGFGKYEIL